MRFSLMKEESLVMLTIVISGVGTIPIYFYSRPEMKKRVRALWQEVRWEKFTLCT